MVAMRGRIVIVVAEPGTVTHLRRNAINVPGEFQLAAVKPAAFEYWVGIVNAAQRAMQVVRSWYGGIFEMEFHGNEKLE